MLGVMDDLLKIMREAFSGKKEEWEKIREFFGDENLRPAERNGTVVGGLALMRGGQFFGGRSVPMTGISAVAIAPEYRGGGEATKLMCDTVRELHDEGVALSALYPATEPLYRRAGYEQAGIAMEMRVELNSIRLRDRSLPATRIEDRDMDTVRSIYRERAVASPGNLDRNDYNWYEIRNRTTGFLFGDEGYVFTMDVKPPGERREVLFVKDHAATTPAGMQRLLTFLADHMSLRRSAFLFVGPSDPLLAMLPEQRYRPHLFDHWMLRITHLEAAIAARGYARAIDHELHFRVADDVVEGNAGDWVVRVADGAGQAERGGRGEVTIDVRALASLYSGHLNVPTLRTIGWIDGPDEALEAAQSVFAGPAPWMSDGF